MKQLEQLLDISAQMTKDLSTMLSIGNMKDSRAVSVFIARKYAQLLTELADEACPRKTRNRKRKRRKDDDCIVVAGIKWAKSNMKVGYKEHFTFDEAQKLCPKGWRIPTNEEQHKLRDECSFYFDKERKEGVFTDRKTGIKLRLPAVGYLHYKKWSPFSNGTEGLYWSQTIQSSSYRYYLCFSNGSVNPSHVYHETYGLSVRCVRD